MLLQYNILGVKKKCLCYNNMLRVKTEIWAGDLKGKSSHIPEKKTKIRGYLKVDKTM